MKGIAMKALMGSALRSILLCWLLLHITDVSGSEESNLEYAPDRVLVKLKETLSIASVSLPGVVQRSSVGRTGAPNVFRITDGASVEDKVASLRKLPEVEAAEPDFRVKAAKTPSDPLYAYQWHLPKIKAPDAWNIAQGTAKVKVCIIDSGLRKDHPDFTGQVAKGWNMVPDDQYTPGPQPLPGTASYFNYNDTQGHGTHVAGLLGAVGNNAIGVSGTAWKASLLICRFIWNNGAGYISDAINCMELCRGEGAHIYSNSWGGLTTASNILLNEINTIGASGGLFVVAAGNEDGQDLDYSPVYPAAYKTNNLLTVAASTQNDGIAFFSNVGKNTVHLAAPGVDIYSTKNTRGYGLMSGTSMATPIISGAAAVLQALAISYNAPLNPLELRTILMNTVDPISGGSTLMASGGRLNLYKAVSQLQATLAQRANSTQSSTTPSSLEYLGNVTLRDVKNLTNPYLYVKADGSIYMSTMKRVWMRYKHTSTGMMLFKTPGGRYLSTNGGTCSKLVSYTSYDSSYRRWKIVTVSNTSPTQRWLLSVGCSTTTNRWTTAQLAVSSDTTKRAYYIMAAA